jgi:hypothetical protein
MTAVAVSLRSPSLEPPEASPPEYLDGSKLHNSSSPPPSRSVVALTKSRSASDIVTEYMLSKKDVATLYMSPNTYFKAFEEVINLRKFNLKKHRMARVCLAHSDRHLYLGGMTPSTPGAKIPR